MAGLRTGDGAAAVSTTIPKASLRPVRRKDLAAVRRLVQLYLYDLGGERWGVNTDGTFGSPEWHRRFWMRRGKHHFIVLVGGRLAGFALVSDRAHFAGAGVREISEFFVLRTYRRRGVGSHTAGILFERFPGKWEVAELTWNVAARRFWHRLIGRYAAGAITERRCRHGDLGFFVQHFETTAGRGRRRPQSTGKK